MVEDGLSRTPALGEMHWGGGGREGSAQLVSDSESPAPVLQPLQQVGFRRRPPTGAQSTAATCAEKWDHADRCRAGHLSYLPLISKMQLTFKTLQFFYL